MEVAREGVSRSRVNEAGRGCNAWPHTRHQKWEERLQGSKPPRNRSAPPSGHVRGHSSSPSLRPWKTWDYPQQTALMRRFQKSVLSSNLKCFSALCVCRLQESTSQTFLSRSPSLKYNLYSIFNIIVLKAWIHIATTGQILFQSHTADALKVVVPSYELGDSKYN